MVINRLKEYQTKLLMSLKLIWSPLKKVTSHDDEDGDDYDMSAVLILWAPAVVDPVLISPHLIFTITLQDRYYYSTSQMGQLMLREVK